MKKCLGCGVTLQTIDPQMPGYIRQDVFENLNEENGVVYCERCYKLIHYNQNTVVEIKEEVFFENIKKINDKDVLIVNVVDIFDLEGTLVENIRKYFLFQDLIVIGNKFDLFLESVKREKIKDYLDNYLKEKNINPIHTLITSSLNKQDLETLGETLEKYANGRDIYFFGYTNVGKSSLLNGLLDYYKVDRQKITVSQIPATTLDLIEITLPNQLKLYDMPGIINPKQLTHYLEKKNLKLVLPKKRVKPKVYQLEPGQVLFIGGVCRIIFEKGANASFVVYVSNNLIVHRRKKTNYHKFYEEHKDDLLKIPNKNERKGLGNFVQYKYQITKEEKIDITISGLGFITIVGDAYVTIETFANLKVAKRKAII